MEDSVTDGNEEKGHPFARISVEVCSSAAEIPAFPDPIDPKVWMLAVRAKSHGERETTHH